MRSCACSLNAIERCCDTRLANPPLAGKTRAPTLAVQVVRPAHRAQFGAATQP